MESLSRPEAVTFDVLRMRLIQQVKLRINSGEFTERSLARILGVSQSQLHNVLKGARQLHFYLADQLLTKLGISTMDLANETELDAALRLKMAEWDRQLAVGNEEDSLDYDLETLIASPRKPAGRSSTNYSVAENSLTDLDPTAGQLG